MCLINPGTQLCRPNRCLSFFDLRISSHVLYANDINVKCSTFQMQCTICEHGNSFKAQKILSKDSKLCADPFTIALLEKDANLKHHLKTQKLTVNFRLVSAIIEEHET